MAIPTRRTVTIASILAHSTAIVGSDSVSIPTQNVLPIIAALGADRQRNDIVLRDQAKDAQQRLGAMICRDAQRNDSLARDLRRENRNGERRTGSAQDGIGHGRTRDFDKRGRRCGGAGGSPDQAIRLSS